MRQQAFLPAPRLAIRTTAGVANNDGCDLDNLPQTSPPPPPMFGGTVAFRERQIFDNIKLKSTFQECPPMFKIFTILNISHISMKIQNVPHISLKTCPNFDPSSKVGTYFY